MPFSFRKLEPREMGTGGVTRTLMVLAVPAALSGLLGTTYELVDRLFVSWLGVAQVAGVGISMPVLFFVWALGSAAGLGVSALVSRRLGQRDPDGARRVLDQALLVAVCLGGALSIIGPLAARPILDLITGHESAPEVLDYGTAYLSRIILGAVLIHLAIVGDAGLRAQGNTVTGMWIMVLGNAINLVLVGFFIFGEHNAPTSMPRLLGAGPWLTGIFTRYGLDLGVQGGATVTVLTRLLTVVLLLRSLWSRRSHVRPSNPLRVRPRLEGQTLLEIYTFGLPMTVAMLSMSISAGVVNRILTQHGPTPLAVLVIANQLEMFAFVPVFSLGGAVVPMVSYNLGAGLLWRCRKVILTSCVLASGVMGVLGLVLLTMPRTFLVLFNDEPALLAMGTSYLQINAWSYFIVGIDIMLSSGFQGLGRPILSMLVQLVRTLIVKVPAAWLLALTFGVTGVWWSSPISTMACFVTASLLMWWLLGRFAAHPPAAAPEPVVEAPTDGPLT